MKNKAQLPYILCTELHLQISSTVKCKKVLNITSGKWEQMEFGPIWTEASIIFKISSSLTNSIILNFHFVHFILTACSFLMPINLIPSLWMAIATSMTGIPTIPNTYSMP